MQSSALRNRSVIKSMQIGQEIYEWLEHKEYAKAEKALLLELKHDGTNVAALGCLASVYIERGEQEEAARYADRLLELQPNDAYTLFLQERICFMAGEHVSLISRLQYILANGQQLSEDCQEKIYNLLGQCWRYVGNSQKSTEAYKLAVQHAESMELRLEEYSNFLFNLHYIDEISEDKKFEAHCDYQCLLPDIPMFFHRKRSSEGKIRLGYISPDLREHVVMQFAYALFSNYDHENFEVHCYANGPEDRWSQQAAACVDGWRNIADMSAEQAARLIYDDKIDVLFDLSGHTRHNCLPILAYKPAPVQISGIGYFATTGLAQVDYFLGDAYLDSAGGDAYFREQILALPHSHFCYTPSKHVPLSGKSAWETNGYITFGSFNNFTKVTDRVLSVWHQLLERVPGSKLLLKAAVFDGQAEREYIRKRFLAAGLDVSRIECRGFSREYLSEYADVDIALDTFPYPGGGTTCDALYMGVPVITLVGKSHGERFGYSILMNAGLEECCAFTEEEYISRAVMLAKDPELLQLLHHNLRSMLEKSPLMSRKSYLKELETGYRQIWQEYCRTQYQTEKFQDITALVRAMQIFSKRGDWEQAMAAADALLENTGTLSQAVLEEIIAVYIDARDTEKAAETVQRLLKDYGEYGYGLFLASRAAYMQQNWHLAETLGLQALNHADLKDWQRGAIYDILATIAKEYGDVEKAAGYYLTASRLGGEENLNCADYSNYLFSLHYLKRSRTFMYDASCAYNEFFKAVIPYQHKHEQRHEKLRVGYISPDLCKHVVALFSYAFFRDYDKNCFEVYCYANCKEDIVSREIAGMVDGWQNISGMSPMEVAKKIYEDEIDILCDLAGHTRGNCLPVLAYKPAPIQISGIGYFNTTGLKTIDYFLADAYTDPVEMENGPNDLYFTEKLLRMSKSHFCYTWHGEASPCLPAPFQKNGYITFGSFNNFSKVTDEMLCSWKEILDQVPGAKLFLKAGIFNSTYGREKAMQRLHKAGIPNESILAEGHSTQYLQEYSRMDIALDTYPYPGGGTTCDALYMGVPVITLVGERHNARFGYSLLMNTGLAECCAFSTAEYVELAVNLARNERRLRELHQILRRKLRQSPVMDAGAYMAELENKYLTIWQNTIQQEMQPMIQGIEEKDWAAVIRSGLHLATQTSYPAKLPAILGRAYSEQGNASRAVYWLQKAVLCDDENKAQLYFLLGANQQKIKDDIAAAHSFEQAGKYRIHQSADFQANVLVRQAVLILDQPEKAAQLYLEAYKKVDTMWERCNLYSSYLLTLHYSECDENTLKSAQNNYAAIFHGIVPYQHQDRKAKKKLRIGYLSPDFRQHVMFHFYYALLACYDTRNFEVYCYQLNESEDGYTRLLRSFVDSWQNIAKLSYKEAAAKIYEDEIDILFDLAGHTAGSGLPVLAWKPAPVQITGLGYPGKTGLPMVDYFVTDVSVVPKEHLGETGFEQPLYLDSQFCYAAREDVPQPQAAPCSQTGCIQFGVFNHYYKITDRMLLVWKEILDRIPGARLLLKSAVMASDSTADTVYQRFQALEFDMDRVSFEPATTDYMTRYLDIDIALDTWPYTGGGTTCDALYMGVPVITLYGERYESRFGLSILQAAGLGELAAATPKEYINRAVSLANDRELLDELHQNLRAVVKKSKLMDAAAYMRNMERQYRKIWQKWQNEK